MSILGIGMHRNFIIHFFLIFASLPGAIFSQSGQRVITDNDLKSGFYTWTADTTYILDGIIFLEENGVLEIQKGTIIQAKKNPSTGDATTALIITRNAQIRATGEYLEPIIFTSISDDPRNPSDIDRHDRGLWGGLVILGNAPVSASSNTLLTPNIPFLDQEDPRTLYGGDSDEDNSGILNFVSIRFAGAINDTDHIPGLTLAGVGSQTEIDFVEVFASGSDGFLLLGGKPEMLHCSSVFSADDSYDWDLGFQGKGQFWFSMQSDDISDYGIEAKGATSKPVIFNVTLIGAGQSPDAFNPGALIFKEGSAGTIGMSIFTDFPAKALEIEDLQGDGDSWSRLENGELNIVGNVWSSFGSGDQFAVGENGIINVSPVAEHQLAQELIDHLDVNNEFVLDVLPQISREQDQSLDPDVIFEEGFINTDLYPDDDFFRISLGGSCTGKGAFMENGAWWIKYWSALDQDNYMRHPCIPEFFKMLEYEGVDGDTINIECSEGEELGQDIYYLCFNSKCFFGEQLLAVAMRNAP